MLRGDGHVGGHVRFARAIILGPMADDGTLSQRGELRPAGAQLVGGAASDLLRAPGRAKAWRIEAAATLCWPFGTWASALRIQ